MLHAALEMESYHGNYLVFRKDFPFENISQKQCIKQAIVSSCCHADT